jgi:hypothetical protein
MHRPTCICWANLTAFTLQGPYNTWTDGSGGICGDVRARSHCCLAPPLIHFIPESLTYSVPLFLKRQCDRTPGDVWKGSSYWCSNTSSGGWAEVDSEVADAAQLQLPVAMSINFTKYAGGISPGSHHISGDRHDLSRIKSWANPEGAGPGRPGAVKRH